MSVLGVVFSVVVIVISAVKHDTNEEDRVSSYENGVIQTKQKENYYE